MIIFLNLSVIEYCDHDTEIKFHENASNINLFFFHFERNVSDESETNYVLT